MAYSKQTWDTTSYVNPTRMNHIEQGIESVEQEIPEIADDLTTDDSTKALSAKQGKVLNEKIIWTYVGDLTTSNSLNVSNYEELNIIPYVNGAIPYNPYFIRKFQNSMEFFISVFQDSTYNTSRKITITNGVISQTQNTLNGWSSCSLRIYAR